MHSWQECRGAAHLHLLPLPLLCPDPRRLDTVLHFLFPIFPLLVFLFSNCVYTHIYIYIFFFSVSLVRFGVRQSFVSFPFLLYYSLF